MNEQIHWGLWLFCAFTVLAGILGLLLLFGGLRRFLHGRFINGGLRMLVALVLLLSFALVVSVALNLRTYLRFTYEQPVATLDFKALGPQDFNVTLTDAKGQITTAELRGDDWQLDARVIKWKGLATLLGLDALYSLERLEGRYRNAGQERNDYHSVVELSRHAGVDLWTLAQRYGAWLPWVDTGYGSATYLPMADGARYTVSLSPTGLLARPANPAAEQAAAHW